MALRTAFGNAPRLAELVETPPAGAERDDVLDAYGRRLDGPPLRGARPPEVGGGLDERGLRMEMFA